MKKILVALLSILVVLSTFSVCVFAEDVAHISLDNITVKSGENVEMPIKISNNKGIWGLVFNVCFDTKAFQVKEVRTTGEIFNKSDIMIGPADFNDGYVRVVVTPADVMNDNTKNGTICTIVLEQTEFAAATSYPFTFDYEDTDFCNVDAEYVSVSSTNGSVNIVEESAKETVAQKTDKTKKTSNKKDVLGDVIVKAEDNKIIDEYEEETQSENIESTQVNKDSDVDKLDKENDGSAVAIGSSDDPTSNLFNVIFYICVILLFVGIVVLIVVLVKKNKK